MYGHTLCIWKSTMRSWPFNDSSKHVINWQKETPGLFLHSHFKNLNWNIINDLGIHIHGDHILRTMLKYRWRHVVWLPMRQLFAKIQMKCMLAIIRNRTASNYAMHINFGERLQRCFSHLLVFVPFHRVEKFTKVN